MALSINSNLQSLYNQNNLKKTQQAIEATFASLSSGTRITSASVDAAGLGISTGLEADIRSYNQAARNTSDGLSAVDTADGGLSQTSDILGRLRELAVQSSSSGIDAGGRAAIATEANQLTQQLDQVANATEYNGTQLLSGNGTQLTFQVGINGGAGNTITASGVDARANTLLGGPIDLSTQGGAQSALQSIDNALSSVSTGRAALGAVGNQLNSANSTIQNASLNLSAADSRINDVDVAAAASSLASQQIQSQFQVAVQAQANQQQGVALRLLG
jgi:flagellin